MSTTSWDMLVSEKLFCLCGAYIVVEMINKIYFFMLMNAMEKRVRQSKQKDREARRGFSL